MVEDYRVSVIITCKGRLKHLKTTLGYWDKQETSPHEVIVVDYGCPDKSGEWVEENHPKVKVVKVKSDKWNISHARNVGGVSATGNALLFIDADVIAPEDTIKRFTRKLKEGNDLVCVANYSHKGEKLLNGQCAVTSEIFHKVRGYDESTEHYSHEDIRFYRDIERAGGKTGYIYNIIPFPHNNEERVKYYDLKDMKVIHKRQIEWLLDRNRPHNPNGYGVCNG